MDPFTIATGCAGFLSVALQLTEVIHTFSVNVREAKADAFQLNAQIGQLRNVVLFLHQEVVVDPTVENTIPTKAKSELKDGIDSCTDIFDQIKALLAQYETGGVRQRIAWATDGHRKAAKLCASLDAHYRILDLALKTISWSAPSSVLPTSTLLTFRAGRRLAKPATAFTTFFRTPT